MLNREENILQLAMFMQRRDALQFGVVTDGVVTPSWEDTGPAQEEYLAEATAFLGAVEVLGYALHQTPGPPRMNGDTAIASGNVPEPSLKYKIGDQVRVNVPGDSSHGRIGKVTGFGGYAARPYTVTAPEPKGFRWIYAESELEPVEEIDHGQ